MTPFTIDGRILFSSRRICDRLMVFMAGWGSNNKYSMLGAMRAIAQMISTNCRSSSPFLPVVMIVGSLNPDKIVGAQAAYSLGFIPHWFVFTPGARPRSFCFLFPAWSNRIDTV